MTPEQLAIKNVGKQASVRFALSLCLICLQANALSRGLW